MEPSDPDRGFAEMRRSMKLVTRAKAAKDSSAFRIGISDDLFSHPRRRKPLAGEDHSRRIDTSDDEHELIGQHESANAGRQSSSISIGVAAAIGAVVAGIVGYLLGRRRS
jgi:hypothetical protein